MAKLKLMKKEWMNWFKGTTLENITAWTEYYYINPDSQHWISNNQLPQLHNVVETTTDGITYSLKDNVLKLNGTATRNTNIFFAQNLGFKLPAGTYTLALFNDQAPSCAFILETETFSQFKFNINLDGINKTQTQTFTEDVTINHIRMYFNANASFTNGSIYPILVKGSVSPERFNPPLIKIEDILGVSKLNDLNWAGSNGSYYVRVTDMKRESSRSDKVFTTRYPSSTSSSHSFAHIFTENGYLNVIDDSHPTLSEFKDYLGDEYVIYLKVDSPY